MKNKKQIYEKIILGILTCVLIIYISFNLIIISSFNISKRFLNKDNVIDFVNDINIVDILKEQFFEEFILIEEEFKNVGITSEGINAFLNSKQVKDFSTEILTNVFNNILNDSSQNLEINKEEVTKLFVDNIDKLQINSILTEKQLLDKLNSKIDNLVYGINNLINELFNKLEKSDMIRQYESYINKSMELLDIIYSDIVLVVLIFNLVIFILLLIYIRKSVYKALKYVSISFMISSLLLSIVSFVIINYIKIENLLIDNILNIVSNDINMYSYKYILIALLIIVINIIKFLKDKYKKINE